MLDLEFTRFKNRNVLFYPRMSGIGDCFPVMGAGLARFSGEPFILACGMISPLIKIAYPHYAKFYSELFAPFDLCEEVIFHDGEYLDDVEETLEAYLACGANVYFLKDSLPLNHGYKDTFENLEMIQERFSDHYHPTAMGAAGALDCGRINICFQIRHSSGIRGMKKKYQNRFLERNVDLEKWISFLVWVADSFDIRLIGIGDSNPESPWHIPGHKLAPLLIHPNIRMPAWTHGTTLAEDLYLLHASDIFIGTHSGPQILSWLTQKPTLCFDYGERGSEINFLRRSGSPLQRTFWDRQSLDQMKELFADYMENAFARFGRARRSMVIATMQREILEVIGSAMHGGAASPLGQRLAEEVQTASRKLKGPMIYRFFSEISFKLGRLLLDGGDVKAARLLLQRCGPTVPVSESELSDVVRDLRRVGEAQTARRLELRNQTGAEDGFRSKFMMA